MPSQNLLAIASRVPSPDLEDIDDDNADLLTCKQLTKKRKLQKKRHWAFLAVNAFVLLLNIGALLMMSVPRFTTVAEDIRLPHSGTSANSTFLSLVVPYIRELISTQIGYLPQ